MVGRVMAAPGSPALQRTGHTGPAVSRVSLVFFGVALGLAGSAHAMGLDLLAFLAAFAAAATPAYLLKGSESRSPDVFRPIHGLAVLLLLYAMSTLIFVQQEGITYYGESVDPRDLATYRIACILTMLGLALGTCWGQLATQQGRPPSMSVVRTHQSLLIWGAGLLGLATAPFIAIKFLPWMATSYAETALSLRVDRMADAAAGVKEILLEALPVTLVLCACVVIAADRHRLAWARLIAAALFVAYLLTSMLSGWRGQMMVAVLLAAIYGHYRVRRIHPGLLILGGLAVYVLINVLSVVRASSDPVEMIQLLLSEVGERGLQFLALQQSGELATSTNLLRLIEGLRVGETDYGWGSIALGQFAAFVPRVILPDRPEVASELFVKIFYPGVLEAGGGYGFFMPQDGYWDFGLVGVLVYGLLFGLALEWLYRRMMPLLVSDVWLLAYALLYSQLVLAAIRSGAVGSFKAALLAAVPMMTVLAATFALRLWRTDNRLASH